MTGFIFSLKERRFAAHGLVLGADFPLALAAAATQPIDIRLVRRRKADAPPMTRADWVIRGSGHLDVAHRDSITVLASYCGSLAWFDRQPDLTPTIHVARAPSISSVRFSHTVLHSFVPNAATAWGLPMLHACAIVVDGRAVLLSGPSGAGKSTLAAGFLARGNTVLSDDVIRVERADNGWFAYPSYPGARLRANSFLLADAGVRPRSGTFGLPKYRVKTDVTPASGRFPVAAMLFLGRSHSPKPSLDALSGGALLNEWLDASFVQALPRERFARETFSLVGAMAQRIPSYRLRYKRSPQHFQQLLDGIVELVRTLPES